MRERSGHSSVGIPDPYGAACRRQRPAALRRPAPALALAAGLTALIGLVGLIGCGEKISLPEAKGLFGVNDYLVDTVFVATDPVDVAVINNNVFILCGTGCLTKRDQQFGEIARVEGLSGPTVFCAGDASQVVFVWEQDIHQVSV
jgi:hypothetical protein